MTTTSNKTIKTVITVVLVLTIIATIASVITSVKNGTAIDFCQFGVIYAAIATTAYAVDGCKKKAE